jgi:aspartate aminotransferase
MPQLALSAERMPRSGIRRLMDAAWASGQPFIGMHVGEPSFSPPNHVIEAARQAYAAGDTHYVANAGVPALRQAISEKLLEQNGLAFTPAQIVVSAGGAQALQVAFASMLQAGDEALIPDPGWPNYAMAIELLQATPVPYALSPDSGFMPQIDQLEALVTDRTRVIVVNTPSNPLGTVMPEETVRDLVSFAQRRGIWLLSDECYDALTYGRPHVSPARFDNSGVVVCAFSFSKTYAMTGVRVGYLACPEGFAEVAAKLQEPMIACVNAPAQAAAIAALRGPQDQVSEMRDAYGARRTLAMKLLDENGIPYLEPHGAFYIWVDLRGRISEPVDDWVIRLLEEQQVAVAPGTAFGAAGEGWVRLSLAADEAAIEEGIARIGKMR